MDAYMAEYMIEEGEEVLHADKSVESWRSLLGNAVLYSFGGLFPLIMLYGTFGSLHVSALDALALMAPLLLSMVVLPLIFVVRVAVTDRRVAIQQGLMEPSIELERITSCRVVTRRLRDAFHMDNTSTEYAGFGSRGVRVEITWTGDDGVAQRTYVKVRHPDALVSAITHAAGLCDARVEGVVLDLSEEAESVVHASEAAAFAGR